MNVQKQLAVLVIVGGVLAAPQTVWAEDAGFRFLATGDLPYSAVQDDLYRRLLKQSENEDFAFLMHVGDIKGQGQPCSDDVFLKIRDMFRAYPKPVVYTPGDNEWTDCHGVGADPIERLDKLRELFFNDPTTLRLENLKTVHQNRVPSFTTYVENYRFSKAGVLFIVVHVVGSGNNYRVDHPPSMEEFSARNAANLAFLQESFTEALSEDVPGIAVVIHANPGFEKVNESGFKDFLASMRGFLATCDKPVVCIHGDTHTYRIDKPFKNESGTIYPNFTRMEVFGSPDVVGVVVSVDPSDPEIFTFQPYNLQEN